MPRNRMIKPEFWSDQDLCHISLGARLLFIGIWNFCDDFGVCLDSNRKLLGDIFPLDEDITEKKVNAWKNELIDKLMILQVIFEGGNYLIVRTWKDHQKVDNPSGRRWLSDESIESLSKAYIDSREPLDRKSLYKEERGKRKEKEEREYVPVTEKNQQTIFKFEEFWQAYPRRNGKIAGKKECLDWWKINSGKINLLEFKTAVDAYARSDPALGGFARDPIRFLKKDWWKDWIPKPARKDPMVDQWQPDPKGLMGRCRKCDGEYQIYFTLVGSKKKCVCNKCNDPWNQETKP